MKAVVLGDIGWSNLYHLGDEAMTEVAVSELVARGIKPVLVSGDPKVAEQMYGVSAVPRVGFWSREGKTKHHIRMRRLMDALDGEGNEYVDLFGQVEDSDFVLIAGGGNLNDALPSHVYERLAWKRIAEHFGKPLLLTSQTIGPALTEDILDAVTEILRYATVVGCRDSFSARLVTSLTETPAKVVHTIDDASLLSPTDDSRERAEGLVRERIGTGSYMIGAFTSHLGTTGYSPAGYVDALREILVRVSRELGVPFLLTPHVGSLLGNVRDDEENHGRIPRLEEDSDHILSLPTETAQVVLALTQGAIGSISTRYHPGVFATATNTPHIGLIQSYYASVKVGGALQNYGLGDFGLPFICPDDAVSAVLSANSNAHDLALTMGEANQLLLARQRMWWDSLVEAGTTGSWSSFALYPRVPRYRVSGDWVVRTKAQLPLFEEISRLRS